MKIYSICILLVCMMFCNGCIFFTKRYIPVYPMYPVLKVEKKPKLKNLSSSELNPYYGAIKIANKIMEDGVITDEEMKEFNEVVKTSNVNSKTSHKKIVATLNQLIKWGNMNVIEIDTYNKLATKKNVETEKILNLKSSD